MGDTRLCLQLDVLGCSVCAGWIRMRFVGGHVLSFGDRHHTNRVAIHVCVATVCGAVCGGSCDGGVWLAPGSQHMMLNLMVACSLLAMALGYTHAATVIVMVFVGLLPWCVAGDQHPNRTVVTILGLLGILVDNLLLLWVVAMIWASVGKRAE